MAPLTDETPKPLLPLWGRPVLAHVLDMLAGWGVNDVLVNLHHVPGAVVDNVPQIVPARMKVNFSFEPEILGTGGAIWRAAWFIDRDPFWIVNGDIAVDMLPCPIIRCYQRMSPVAVAWLSDTVGPRTVEMTDGRITNFASSCAGRQGTYTFCGLQLVSPVILRYLHGAGFSSIIDAYRNAMAHGQSVLGVCVPGSFWADIGTPETYLDAHRTSLTRYRACGAGNSLFVGEQAQKVAALERAGVQTSGFVSVGRNVHVGRGARIRDSVILDGAVIGGRARIENAIIGKSTRITGRVRGVAVRLIPHTDPDLDYVVDKLGWPAKEVCVLPLGVRGSDRSFTRIQYRRCRAIVVRYGRMREENSLYVQNARFLRKIGVRVPDIRLDIPCRRMFVMEDVGDCCLLDRVRARPASVAVPLYRKALACAAIVHGHKERTAAPVRLRLCEPFSPAVYRWERELFARHFLKGKLHLAGSMISRVLREIAIVPTMLGNAPPVLVHRDFQSTNVMFLRGQPVLIDFQGMRYGPAVYDLASLVCDPYVSLPGPVQEKLVDWYADRVGQSGGEIMHVFWWAAVQRLVQAIGAYARLSVEPGTEQFGRHIGPALEMMDRALEHVDKLTYLREIVVKARRRI